MVARRFTIILGSIALAGPAFAQDGPPAPAPTPAPEKKICRTIVPTGSIMGKRFCLTKTEWKQFGDISTDSAETMLNSRRLISPKGDPIPQ